MELPQLPMQGKVCLLTGATDGIGKEAALQLARQGAQVVLVGRNPQKTAQVLSEIRAVGPTCEGDALIADLSVQAEVRRVAAEFQARYRRLDVLINNAGGLFERRIETQDGLEMTFALNHLAYFLLTQELRGLLLASQPARVVNTSSIGHFLAGWLNFGDLQSRRMYIFFLAYCRSKLANLYFTYELARQLHGTQVTVNAVHPGFVASNLGENNTFFKPIFALMKKAAITPAQGGQNLAYLAANPALQAVSGGYFHERKQVSSSPVSYNSAAARQLWEISGALTTGNCVKNLVRLQKR